ncbi:4-hydroxythreonine-4-phosphate dehydrogenase [Singulisphaera sp. GP187]|uniref:4-hydroxythreonine-4-phosphate dehydrogenase PdxA n=1 Tax=Singulisphaera sp. GP187 TaxID=1882752 RepID=UPI00092BE835|nr:4-hydroxythreonine-4-phosphate dehydrogenase PdxA [Singulisphaera sp. GP187]SIO61053.1 4-hydroxythreonine-4-phosphate dehydrogenase [Singulisphaera sp. GP187]
MIPQDDRPLVALTMGDVAGIGPEVIARAWGDSPLRALARPFVIGSKSVLERALACVGGQATVQSISRPEDARPTARLIPCLEATDEDVADIAPGLVDPRAGRAAYDYLITAVDLALAGRIDAITTLPLHKEALRAGGVLHPGHTEILAERCGILDHAMMLYIGPPVGAGDTGLGVVHATLHVPLRSVFDLLTVEAVESKILLADRAIRPLTEGRPPRVAVAALNPHGGEGGLFGDEEERVIAPAIARAVEAGINATGPIACDTLFVRAIAGEFDAVVAMYHDQGHVALKTIGFDRAVNVTLGLPIIRTSVAHGTAFDIAWKGRAETSSLIEAVRVAARLVAGKRFAVDVPPTIEPSFSGGRPRR